MIEITNEDCMDLMARYPDKHFDLCIVDPPYGIGLEMKTYGSKNAKRGDYEVKGWNDNIPLPEYFNELHRVSKNQIIWGCNFYGANIKGPGRIVWDKKGRNGVFSQCDIAYQSFNRLNYMFEYAWHGFIQQDMGHKETRIHPTQKPVALYKWLLKNYAKPGDKILDTHLGSGSIAIACHDAGYDLTACEIDKDYYEAAMKRLRQHQAQFNLFEKVKSIND